MKHFSEALFDSLQESIQAIDIDELCRYVTSKLSTFGGNCGSFAIALYTKLTELNYAVELVLCSNIDDIRDANWTDENSLDWYLNGEPDIYHVAVRLNADNNKLFDGDGLTTIDSLVEFCDTYYRNPNASIDAWTIDNTQDYELFYKIFRYNTNMSIHPIEFEDVIDDYLNAHK